MKSTVETKICELVKLGHELAKELHCAESAALVSDLATQLEVQFARSNALTAKLSMINGLMDAAEQANKLAQEATEKLVQERDALASLDAGSNSNSNSNPAPGPLSNYRLHRIREILGKAAAQSDGGNIGYAMSDAVKAIDELLEVRTAEPDYIRYDCGCCGWETIEDWRDNDVCPKCNHKPMCKTELFTAPPAPVANDDLHEAVSDLLAALDKYPEQLVPINRKSFLVRTIRAAMLNGGKS